MDNEGRYPGYWRRLIKIRDVPCFINLSHKTHHLIPANSYGLKMPTLSNTGCCHYTSLMLKADSHYW